MTRRSTTRAVLAGAAALLLAGAAPAVATAQEPAVPRPAPSVPVQSPPAPPPANGKPAVDTADIRQREYWLDDYGVRDAWRRATGKGVKIAVIDTGVDGSHPDLEGAVQPGTDASGAGQSDGRKGLGAEPEHGTLVSSLAAGRGHGAPNAEGPGREKGVLGVAPDADILPVSLWLGNEEPGVKDVNQQIPDAVRWAVDHGADVINMSVGSDSTAWPQSWDSAFAYAEEKNVLVVAAAGNRGSGLNQVGAPATIPGVLSVGGVDRSGRASWDSSSQGISIAVAGPSEDMVGAMPGGGYAEWSGTSATAPLVAGTAALIKQEHPDLTAAQVAQRIVKTAHDAGDKGKDPIYGYGVLDVRAAVLDDVETTQENPLGSIRHWIEQNRPRSASPQPSATPSTAEGDTRQVTEEATPPVAQAPLNETGALPVVVLTSFGLVVAGLTVAAILHIRRLSR
ncbi:S8 family serine peptidase [Kocuria rhizophila]|uniref:Putative subtilisin family peptidase n=1 Tax=Kocuria rhizophila (strain ATCC 9341 / DSM 348 / NBRC 103217 / DC2201) TaxID=378753 RepID=B2GLQ1_KOCRD|nr:S8 family serine peptidase [Kocuria rhizophila]ASE12097.1 peptidase S8 [Kocuria rhizophila]MDV5999679.1 S8 family serine peptidase [Kocuria rhizophila]BAG30125.1 putative subtilisin family peptidase [Kocuria rhizophila DC2201]VEH74606.1 Subtilisin DY [Kocuria rhizophila]